MPIEYNISWLPAAGKRVPFSKFFMNADSNALALQSSVAAIRDTGADMSITSNLITTSVFTMTPVIDTGTMQRMILVCVDAIGRLLRIILEHVPPAGIADTAALLAAVIANCTFPDGAAIVNIPKVIYEQVIVV